MTMDRTFIELNRVSRVRMRALADRLSDADLQQPVGEHWNVAVVFSHLAFWDRRVIYVLDISLEEGKLFIPNIDIFVNDLNLPFWLAIPPPQAVRIGIETADQVDNRLEAFPESLLDEIYTYNQRWVVRALHRNQHLDQVEAALTR